MQNDTSEKYNPLVYRILGSISTHASELSGKRLHGYVFACYCYLDSVFGDAYFIALRSDGLGPGLVSVSVGTMPHQFLQ